VKLYISKQLFIAPKKYVYKNILIKFKVQNKLYIILHNASCILNTAAPSTNCYIYYCIYFNYIIIFLVYVIYNLHLLMP